MTRLDARSLGARYTGERLCSGELGPGVAAVHLLLLALVSWRDGPLMHMYIVGFVRRSAGAQRPPSQLLRVQVGGHVAWQGFTLRPSARWWHRAGEPCDWHRCSGLFERRWLLATRQAAEVAASLRPWQPLVAPVRTRICAESRRCIAHRASTKPASSTQRLITARVERRNHDIQTPRAWRDVTCRSF